MQAFKSRELPLERRRITRSRRAFSFSTYQAQVRLVKYKGKTRVFRPSYEGEQIFAERNLLKARIFHALFQENSLTPVGIALVEENGKQVWGVVTNIVRNRSADYKLYQQRFYTAVPFYAAIGKESEAIERHERFCREIAAPILDKIREAGINVDWAQVNICNAGGKPVFFEAWRISPKKCMAFIDRTVPDIRKREKLIGLLLKLKNLELE